MIHTMHCSLEETLKKTTHTYVYTIFFYFTEIQRNYQPKRKSIERAREKERKKCQIPVTEALCGSSLESDENFVEIY